MLLLPSLAKGEFIIAQLDFIILSGELYGIDVNNAVIPLSNINWRNSSYGILYLFLLLYSLLIRSTCVNSSIFNDLAG